MNTPKKDRPLTKKQAAFVKELIDNPKQSATQAVLKTYGRPDKPIKYNTARALASENLAKPAIRTKLAQYNDMVESTLLQTVQDWGADDAPRKREIAQNAAMYIHDKVHGKATQKVETKSEQVSININMTASQEPTGVDNVAQ